MNSNDFRAELVKIMPGYSWTVHKQPKRYEVEGLAPQPLIATGIQSSGSNRLSTLEVTRCERDGRVTYTAKSSGYGVWAHWLHENTDKTLARALRGLQRHYEHTADTYRSHAVMLQSGRQVDTPKEPS